MAISQVGAELAKPNTLSSYILGFTLFSTNLLYGYFVPCLGLSKCHSGHSQILFAEIISTPTRYWCDGEISGEWQHLFPNYSARWLRCTVEITWRGRVPRHNPTWRMAPQISDTPPPATSRIQRQLARRPRHFRPSRLTSARPPLSNQGCVNAATRRFCR